jgi:hypothetical protein
MPYLKIEKSVNFLGHMKKVVDKVTRKHTPTLSSSISNSITCLVPQHGEFSVSFNSVSFDSLNEKGQDGKYGELRICDAPPVEDSWTVRSGLSELIGEGGGREGKRGKDAKPLGRTAIRGEVYVRGVVARGGYRISVASNRVDVSLLSSSFKLKGKLVVDSPYFNSLPNKCPHWSPVTMKRCSLDSIDQNLFSFWYFELLRLLDDTRVIRIANTEKRLEDAIEKNAKEMEEQKGGLEELVKNQGDEIDTEFLEKGSEFERNIASLEKKSERLTKAMRDVTGNKKEALEKETSTKLLMLNETVPEKSLKKSDSTHVESDKKEKKEKKDSPESKKRKECGLLKSDAANCRAAVNNESLDMTDTLARLADLITSLGTP